MSRALLAAFALLTTPVFAGAPSLPGPRVLFRAGTAGAYHALFDTSFLSYGASVEVGPSSDDGAALVFARALHGRTALGLGSRAYALGGQVEGRSGPFLMGMGLQAQYFSFARATRADPFWDLAVGLRAYGGGEWRCGVGVFLVAGIEMNALIGSHTGLHGGFVAAGAWFE